MASFVDVIDDNLSPRALIALWCSESGTGVPPLEAKFGKAGKPTELAPGACEPSVIRAELPPVRARPGVCAALLRADKLLGTRGLSGDPVSTVPEIDRAAVVAVSICQCFHVHEIQNSRRAGIMQVS